MKSAFDRIDDAISDLGGISDRCRKTADEAAAFLARTARSANRNEIAAVVIAVVATETRRAASEIPETATYADLGIDSLSEVMILMNIEDRLHVAIPDHEAYPCRHVGRLIDIAYQAKAPRP